MAAAGDAPGHGAVVTDAGLDAVVARLLAQSGVTWHALPPQRLKSRIVRLRFA